MGLPGIVPRPWLDGRVMGESMIRRFVRLGVFAIVLAAAMPTGMVLAQPAVQALLPSVIPQAGQARANVVNHPALAAFEIEQTMKEAVAKAKAALTSPQQVAQAREHLLPLEKLGPLRTLPLFELHQLLGAMAGMEGRTEDQTYHRAFSVALILHVDKSGDGKTPQTARRVVMIAEQYDWFFANREVQRKTRVAKEIDGRMYDIWTVATAAGDQELYFDVTAMRQSALRVMALRQQAGQTPR